MLDFGARSHIEYTRAATAKQIGEFKGAEEIALEYLSKISPDQWASRFDIFVLLAQVQLREGSDRWASVESSIAALRIAYADYKDYSLMNHKPGQLFAFIMVRDAERLGNSGRGHRATLRDAWEFGSGGGS